jgi:imidazole glycerol phosphate synthase glutamine amidotransferase subunit
MLQIIGVIGGNLGSVQRAFDRLAVPYTLITQPQQLQPHSPIVLPGVGAFGAVMDKLNAHGLTQPIKQLVQAGTPYLGICLGQQIMFAHSEETPGVPGLGLLPGSVRRFASQAGIKIPQVGWNAITPQQPHWPTGFVYFVNSFVAHPDNASHTLYTATYGQQAFCAAIHTGNITAFQFHPEKSSTFGLGLLKQWTEMVGYGAVATGNL